MTARPVTPAAPARPPAGSAQPLPLAQWLTSLREHVPAAFMRANTEALASFWADGCTVAEGAALARACLHAPAVARIGCARRTLALRPPTLDELRENGV